MNQILPCPFCGGIPKLLVSDDEGNIHGTEYENDPWSGLGYRLEHAIPDGAKDPVCPVATFEDETIGTRIYDTREEATEAWNKRFISNSIDINQLESNIEFLSEQVHNAWWNEKRKQGFHAPDECPVPTDESKAYLEIGIGKENMKRHNWCPWCHSDCYSYAELPENNKEYDRVTVRTVLDAIKKMEGI